MIGPVFRDRGGQEKIIVSFDPVGDVYRMVPVGTPISLVSGRRVREQLETPAPMHVPITPTPRPAPTELGVDAAEREARAQEWNQPLSYHWLIRRKR